MNTSKNIEQVIAISLLILLLIGSYLVMQPFISALLWAALLCYATWPLFSRLNTRLKNRRNTAALLLCIALTAVVIAPLTLVAISLAENVNKLNGILHTVLAQGLPLPPDWVATLPLVGDSIHSAWISAASDTASLLEPLKRNLPELSKWLLGRGVALGNGVLQMSLAMFILFFLYRDGEVLAHRLNNALERIGGAHARTLLQLAGSTVKGVVYGILGTAIAQGILAGIGFWMAGVPSALLLGLITFFLSVIPVGPPLVWLPAAAWLYYQGQVGWAIFLVIWGVAVVSSIDNFLKPYLISQGAAMPFVLVLLGVLGGLAAFGFVGVFLGPTLLAVGYSIVRDWTLSPTAETPAQP